LVFSQLELSLVVVETFEELFISLTQFFIFFVWREDHLEDLGLWLLCGHFLVALGSRLKDVHLTFVLFDKVELFFTLLITHFRLLENRLRMDARKLR
jgi:hypothetical protein